MNLSDLPKEIADKNLPLPNVYFCTVLHAEKGTYSFYLAADSSASAVQKVRNYCASNYGFRPYRSTTDIKLRRFLLGDYLENPEGLMQAADLARELGENSTLRDLEGRMKEVQSLLQQARELPEADDVDYDEVSAMLGRELRAIEAGREYAGA